LKAITAERDRHVSDKVKLVSKTAALSKECESLRAELATATNDRESLRGQLDEAAAERLADRGAARGEILDLQERLKAITAERDRHASDNVELVSKTGAHSEESESLRRRLAAAVAERDRYAAEKDRAAETIALLENEIATTPPPDLMVVATEYVSAKTKALVARTRAAIPPHSPALPWFDRTISALTAAGQATAAAVRLTARWLAVRLIECYAWAAPRARELHVTVMTKIENWLAKKY
jgi:chromosome segregation ATPase